MPNKTSTMSPATLMTPAIASPAQDTPVEGIKVHIVTLSMLTWAFQTWIESMAPTLRFSGSSTSIAACILSTAKDELDVILVDLDGDDPELALAELTLHTQAKVLALTSAKDDAIKDAAIIAGAKGVLNKRDSVQHLLKAIECVHRGELWIDRNTTSRIFSEVTRAKSLAALDPEQVKIQTLTKREREIIGAILRSPSVKAAGIADEIFISQNTLRNHMVNIYAKLDITNRTELYAFAIKHKAEFS